MSFKIGDRVLIQGDVVPVWINNSSGSVVSVSGITKSSIYYEVIVDSLGLFCIDGVNLQLIKEASVSQTEFDYYRNKSSELSDEVKLLKEELEICGKERDKYKEQLHNDHWRRMYFDLQMEMRRIQMGLSAVQKRIDKVV